MAASFFFLFGFLSSTFSSAWTAASFFFLFGFSSSPFSSSSSVLLHHYCFFNAFFRRRDGLHDLFFTFRVHAIFCSLC
jgi:hypothetical protein